MKKSLVLFFCLMWLASFGQSISVLDKETKKPIEDVTIYNQKKTFTIKSSKQGKVDLSGIITNEIIYFTHINYATVKTTKKDIIQNKKILFLNKKSEELDEVVLTVFKSSDKLKRIAEETAVLHAAEIQRIAPQTSADLLASIPGIKVQKSQLGGGSPVIRGMETNRVLLVVDGVRMNNAIYRKGHIQNSITLSPSILDRTEVIFGPSSVMYGSDALGGVIHYYTKTPEISEDRNVKTQFLQRFSSANNEFTTNASVELGYSKWATYTNISYSKFGDLRMGAKRNHGFDDWGLVHEYSENDTDYYSSTSSFNEDPLVQKNSGYSQLDFLQKFYVPLSDKTDLKINIQYSQSSNIPRFDRLEETQNGSLKFAEWYYGPQKRFLVSPQLEVQSNSGWFTNATFTLGYQNIQESRVQRKFSSLNRTHRNEEVDVFTLNADFILPLTNDKKRNLSYGFEFSYNDVSSVAKGETIDVSGNNIIGVSGDFDVLSRYPNGGSNYFSSAIYVGYRQDISNKSTLNLGLRYTNTHLNALWEDTIFIMLPEKDVYLSNSAYTATAGYAYRPNRNWQLNAVFSSGFRSPNIDDVGRVREKSGYVTIPNAGVKPEYAYNFEVGIHKFFNQKKFRVGLNVYYTLLDKYITRDAFLLNGNSTIMYDGDFGEIVANQNKGTAYITGFTASYLGKISENIKTSGFITYTKGYTNDTHEPMSSIPPLFGNFDIVYFLGRATVGFNMRFNARKPISEYNITEGIDNHDLTPIVNPNAANERDMYFGTPHWMTFGVDGSYTFNQNWKLQGGINNIFDIHYREFASGISSPGRNFMLSLIATF